MKTINNILFAVIITIVSTFTFISCEKSGDTTPPVINLIAPAEGAELMIGKDIHFEMEISDNKMLKSYKVEIHNNIEDPHDHENTAKTLSLKSGTSYFSYQNSWDVSDKKNADIHHHEIEIPEDIILGDYHFIVYCTDAAGNESHVARNIVLIPNDGDDDDHDHDHDDDDDHDDHEH
jgi:hypothetical protein